MTDRVASERPSLSRRNALGAFTGMGLAALAEEAMGASTPQARPSPPSNPASDARPRRSPDLRDWNAVGDRNVADGPKLQRAFDECPLGETLRIPPGDYWLASPRRSKDAGLVLSRQISIESHGGRLVGDFRDDEQSNLLNIRVKEALAGAGDVRLMKVTGLGAFFATGGRTTVDVENATPMASNLQMWFEGCAISTRDDSAGSALRFGGVLTQLHTVINCLIDNQVHLDGCADACRFLYNTIGGTKTGFRVRLALGAFRTLISHNVLVPRDGSLFVEGGSQIDFLFNQCEQKASRNHGVHNAHIFFDIEQNDISRRCNIMGNNFGGGPNVDHSIFVRSLRSEIGVEDLTITGNTFGLTATGVDILIDDDNVRGVQVNPDNFTRGRRGNVKLDEITGRVVTNSVDGSDLLKVVDRGLGTFGVWQHAWAAHLESGWSSHENDPCRFRKTLDNDLQWDGVLVPGSVARGAVIGTLPVGFRPRRDLRISVPTDTGAGTLLIAANGKVGVGNVPTGSTELYMAGVTHRVQGKAGYNPGV